MPVTGLDCHHPNLGEYIIDFQETDILVRDRDMPHATNAPSIRLPMTGQLPVHIKRVRRTRDTQSVLRLTR